MSLQDTGFGGICLPHPVGCLGYFPTVPRTTLKAVLWQNVKALMVARYGKENLTRLATECRIGPGTATRIKEQRTSVGLDVLEQIAGTFHVEPWQLLVPGMDPSNPPVLRQANAAERELYERLLQAAKDLSKLNPK